MLQAGKDFQPQYINQNTDKRFLAFYYMISSYYLNMHLFIMPHR